MISKQALNTENFKRNMIFTKTAREGWKLILNGLDYNAKVLLPSYIGITDREGSGIFDPIIETGHLYDFYLLENDLSISYDALEKCLSNSKYDVILLVHYFGFRIQNIEDIVKLCKKYDLIVVEDCAHLYNYNMYNYSDAGTFGDYAFYSLHKYFPLREGGLLVQNNLNALKLNYSEIGLNDYFSKIIIEYQIESIADKRIKNFKLLDELLLNVKGVKPLKLLGQGDIPHNYPILVENGLREKLYFWLFDKGIPLIALYYRLIDPLQDEQFTDMTYLSNNILNLPVHQDMNNDDIKELVRLIEDGIMQLKE